MLRNSISSVFIASVALALVLAVATITLYVTDSSHRMALDLEEQAMGQSAQAARRALGLYVENAHGMIQSLAGQRLVLEAFGESPEPAQERLKDVLRANPGLWSVIVFDDKGLIRAGTNADGGDLRGQSRADRDYFKAVMSGQELFLGRTVLTAKSGGGDMYIFLAVKAIRDASGRVLGGVGVFPRWSQYTKDFIDPNRFGARGYGFMLDAQGRFIAHAADKALMLQDVSQQDFVKKALAMQSGSFFYDWKGERKFLAVETDPVTGWKVCMSAYESELTATSASQRNMLLGIGAAAVLLLAGAITLLTSRLVTRPIHRIEAFTAAIARGEYRAELNGRFRFEFADLARNIRAMVAELKNRLGFAQGVLQGFVLPCAVADKDNHLTFVNNHLLRAFDKNDAPEAHLGQTSGQFLFNDPQRETYLLKALREKRTIDGEVTYPLPRGVKTFNVTATPFTDLDGNLLGTLAVWFDLTGIKAQQARIEEQNGKIARAAAAADTVSDQVASASEQLSAQIEQSSRGSEEQRNRTAEAAAAVEEMNATVLAVAKSAQAATELAEAAKAQAQDGAALVDEVVTTITRLNDQAEALKADMTELGKQADGIGQIMNVIADIADQTNLLALNAAIEAARAGDAGRGFAVVADEVRKLAEKTMAATNEVGAYIRSVQDSARKNIQGTEATTRAILASTETAGRSGAALRSIVDIVEKTADQVRGIATASQQQSAASEEISRGAEDINRIAGETAEAMGQSAQAVSDLARLAQELKSTISDMQS